MTTIEKFTRIKQETWNLASRAQGSSDVVAEIFPAGLDAKQEQQIRFFSTVGLGTRKENLFLKLFIGSKWQAKAEIVNTNVLTGNHVAGVVPILDSESSGNNTLIVYPNIDGESFHTVLESNRAIRKVVVEKTAAVLQTSSGLEGFQLFKVPEAFLKQYPFPESVFGSPLFQDINRAYNPFWKLRNAICEQCPGLSMDRTPRNIMVAANKEISQIDFEMVYQDSPLFDLAKLLRNGPESGATRGTTLADAIKSPQKIFWKNNPFNQDEEEKLVSQFVETTLGKQDKSKAIYNYWQVAAHTHIFYISKYLRRYNEINNPEAKENSYQRMVFHFAGLLSLRDKLLEPYSGRTDQAKKLLTAGIDKTEVIKLLDLYSALARQIK